MDRATDDEPVDAEEQLRDAMVGYQRGEIAAFERLYAQLAPRLQAYLTSLTRDGALSQDLLQEAFLHIHRSRHTYRPESPIQPWAFAIARHVHLMHCRAAGRRARREAAAAIAQDDRTQGASAEDAVIERDRLRRALDDLPKGRRDAVLLHHVDGHSFKEIAAKLGIGAGAAKVRASRGMATLRRLLSAYRGASK